MKDLRRFSIGSMLFILGLLFLLSLPGDAGATPKKKKSKKAWKDPRKGMIWGKVNIVQIPLTAYENHILGKVQTVRYKSYKMSGDVKVLTDSGYNVYDKAGHLVDQNEYNADGTPKWKCIYKYDDKNKATLWDFTLPKTHEMTTFKYDEKGNQVERDEVTNDTPSSKTVITYNAAGKETEEREFSGKGVLKTITQYNYDAAGNQVEWLYKKADGTQISRMVNTYDAHKNTLESRSYDNDTFFRSRDVMKYDERDNETEAASFNLQGSTLSTTATKYDDEGREVQRFTYKQGGWITARTLTTYTDNTEMEDYTVFKRNGTIDEKESKYTEQKFDKKGNITSMMEYGIKAGKHVPAAYEETEYTYWK